MFGNILFSFFFGMPAVVALLQHRQMHHPVSRAIFLYGGSLSVVCVAMVILPMLGCSGSLMTGYSACTGGAGVTSAANALLPLSISGAYLYLFAGPMLIALALFIERSAKRRAGTA